MVVFWETLYLLTALKDTSEGSINSDWKIELPGEFELAGTTVRYVRRGLWEKMSAKGPTKAPLHLMVSTSFSVVSQYNLDTMSVGVLIIRSFDKH